MGVPTFLTIQRIYRNALCNKCASCLGDFLQRPLNSIKDIVEDSRRKRHRHGISSGCHHLTWPQARRLLIDLNRCPVLLKGNHLSHQLILTYIDHL